jgi:hypothetical protein
MSDRTEQLSDIRYLAELYALQRDMRVARSTVAHVGGYVPNSPTWKTAMDVMVVLTNSLDAEVKRTKRKLGFASNAGAWIDAETGEEVE